MEKTSDGMTETCGEIVEDEFRVVRRGTSVSEDLFRELDGCELEVGGRSIGKVYDGHGVYLTLLETYSKSL